MPDAADNCDRVRPVTSGIRMFQKNLLTLDRWLSVLLRDFQQMNSLWWWRLGTALRITQFHAGVTGTAPCISHADCAVRIQERLNQAWDLFDGKCFTQEQLLERLEELRSALENLYGAIADMRRHPWWRLGLRLRTLAGTLGLLKKDFVMPTAEADDIMEQYRAWEPQSGVPVNAGAVPRETLEATEHCLLSLRHTLFYQHVRALLENNPERTLSAAVAASENDIILKLAEARSAARRPLVSVIMAAYNRADIMGQAIQSVLDQLYPTWELLVCDDGSQDATETAVAQFSDPRIHYLKLVHGGAARARNAGLEQAKGELIAYLDTDNLWHPAYLEVMVAAFAKQQQVYAAYATYLDAIVETDGGLKLNSYWSRQFSFARLTRGNFIDLNTFMHRRELYDCFGGFTEALPMRQDWDLALKYAFLQNPLYVDAFLAFYRRNPAWGQITTKRERFREATDIVMANLERYYAQGLPDKSATPLSVSLVVSDAVPCCWQRASRLADALASTKKWQVQWLVLSMNMTPPETFPEMPDALHWVCMKQYTYREALHQAARQITSDFAYCLSPDEALGACMLAQAERGGALVVDAGCPRIRGESCTVCQDSPHFPAAHHPDHSKWEHRLVELIPRLPFLTTETTAASEKHQDCPCIIPSPDDRLIQQKTGQDGSRTSCRPGTMTISDHVRLIREIARHSGKGDRVDSPVVEEFMQALSYTAGLPAQNE